MRSILVTILLIVAVVGLYQTLFSGEAGLLPQMKQKEETVNERIMRLNP